MSMILRPPSAPSPSAAAGGGGVYLMLGAAAATSALYLLWKTSKSTSEESSKRAAHENEHGSTCVYLDYNGTTPVYAFVVQAMMPYLTEHFGNPSSSHSYAVTPRLAVNRARRQILKLLGIVGNDETAPLDSIWFTSCGTESDNLAIQLALQSTRKLFSDSTQDKKKPHIVTCNVEHPAVEAYLQAMEQEEGACEVTYVPVQTDGRVLAADVIAAIRPGQTILVTLMLANNETGALQPVKEVAQHCRKEGILFHTDAAQAAGKVSIHIENALGGADLVSVVGHKLGAPKGIACLYVRPGCLSEGGRELSHKHGVLLIGGNQEFGRRGGTENVPYIVGFGAAADRAATEWKTNAQHMEQMRNRLLANLQDALDTEEDKEKAIVVANGPADATHRLPNTLSVGIRGAHSGDLLALVGDRVAASAGATCHSAAGVSSVLRAMKVDPEVARGTLRLSMGPHTTAGQIDRAAMVLVQAAQAQLSQRPNIQKV